MIKGCQEENDFQAILDIYTQNASRSIRERCKRERAYFTGQLAPDQPYNNIEYAGRRYVFLGNIAGGTLKSIRRTGYTLDGTIDYVETITIE